MDSSRRSEGRRNFLRDLAGRPVTVMGPRKRSRLRAFEPIARIRRLWRKLRPERVIGSPAAPASNSDGVRDVSEQPPRARFGLIVYEGAFFNNIGDEMQSLAAMQFLPRIDLLVPIDRLHSLSTPAPGSSPVKVIMNGYFTCNPDAWPPPEWIQPLFVSFHLTDIPYAGHGRRKGPAQAASGRLLAGANLDYFKRHEPIGCRDRTTVERFRAAGVQAYFSGCMTLTLQSRWHRSAEKIVLVDVSCNLSKLIRSIPPQLRDRVVRVTHDLDAPGRMSQIERYASAHELLMMYRSARLVVTSRLHCALPCLALGTSVLFVRPEQDVSRFAGLEELLNGISAADAEGGRIDWRAPPANPERHLVLAKRLIRTCRSFVGDGAYASETDLT